VRWNGKVLFDYLFFEYVEIFITFTNFFFRRLYPHFFILSPPKCNLLIILQCYLWYAIIWFFFCSALRDHSYSRYVSRVKADDTSSFVYRLESKNGLLFLFSCISAAHKEIWFSVISITTSRQNARTIVKYALLRMHLFDLANYF